MEFIPLLQLKWEMSTDQFLATSCLWSLHVNPLVVFSAGMKGKSRSSFQGLFGLHVLSFETKFCSPLNQCKFRVMALIGMGFCWEHITSLAESEMCQQCQKSLDDLKNGQCLCVPCFVGP